VTGRWFSLSTPVSSTNKNDRTYITEILVKVVLNAIALTREHIVINELIVDSANRKYDIQISGNICISKRFSL
jgi:hypothetical protein